MAKTRVGVLRGGPSNEFEISLKTGATVLNHIPAETYEVQDIFISRDGTWHKNGAPLSPHAALSHVDVVWNALHGSYGEDGKIQHILELAGIPFTGSGSFSSAIGMNKALSKEVFKKHGIKTPRHLLLEKYEHTTAQKIIEWFKTFPLPFIVKPVSSGSSVGVSLVGDFASFEAALEKAFKEGKSVLVEEYISGTEASVGIIQGYRNQPLYALPPIEIRPPKTAKENSSGKAFFDYDAKYSGGEHAALEIVPGNFTRDEKKELEDLARAVHQALGLRHYSRSDFIVSPKRGIFVLEANTLPGLTEESLVPKALHAVGATLPHFLDHVLGLALSGE